MIEKIKKEMVLALWEKRTSQYGRFSIEEEADLMKLIDLAIDLGKTDAAMIAEGYCCNHSDPLCCDWGAAIAGLILDSQGRSE